MTAVTVTTTRTRASAPTGSRAWTVRMYTLGPASKSSPGPMYASAPSCLVHGETPGVAAGQGMLHRIVVRIFCGYMTERDALPASVEVFGQPV